MKETPAAQRWFSLPGFGVFLGAAIFCCFPYVLLGEVSFYFRDYGVLGYPNIHFLRESFHARELPLWNPYSNCGVPFFAQWGTMCAYPPALIYLLLPLPWSLSFFCFLHVWIGGLGMYLLARDWTENNVAAAIAGAGYTFSGVMFASFIWPNYFVALGWMPLVVLSAERAWRLGGRWIAVAALVAALQLGSGVPEIVVLTWSIVGIILLCDFSETPGNGGRVILRVICVVLLAAGLLAVQLLPFFDLLAQSQRVASDGAAKWSLPVWAAANLIVPLLDCFQTPQGQYFQFGQEFLSSVYIGAPMAALALVGVVKYPVARTWALFLFAVFCVVLAFGDNTPVFPLLRKAIPIASIARYPVKFLFVPAFVVPLLASLAVRGLHVDARVAARPIVYTSLLIGICGGMLVWAAHEGLLVDMSGWPPNFRQNTSLSWKDAAANAAVRGGVLVGFVVCLLATTRASFGGVCGTVAALALLAFDGRTHAPHQNPTLPAAEFQGVAWDETLGPRPKSGESRVFITPRSEEVLLTVSSTNAARLWRAKRRSEWSNLNLLDAVPKVNGSATLQVGAQAKLQTALYGLTNVPNGILDFLAVSHESSAEIGGWNKRETALPLVTAGQSILFTNDEQGRRFVLSPRFDPRKTVVLPPESQETVTATNGASIRIVATRFSNNAVEAEVDAAEPGPVVLAQSHYKNWKGSVDGHEKRLYRANTAFQALFVPAGKHVVRWEYHDPMLRTGMAVSALALVLWLIVLFVPGGIRVQ